MSSPCPVCDVLREGYGYVEALAFGVALGNVVYRGVTELMCSEHRPIFVHAMMRVALLTSPAEIEDA